MLVLVLLSALTSTDSPAPPFVLLQGEIGRPGLKVSCFASPAHHAFFISLSLVHLTCPWYNGIRISPTLCLCDVICPLMCSEYPLQLLNGSCCISLRSCSPHSKLRSHPELSPIIFTLLTLLFFSFFFSSPLLHRSFFPFSWPVSSSPRTKL